MLVELNETVVCTNDHMEVIIPSAFFLNKVPPVYVSNQNLKVLFLNQDVPWYLCTGIFPKKYIVCFTIVSFYV